MVDSDATINELRAQAKEYELSGAGSKEELAQRIAAYEDGVPEDTHTNDEAEAGADNDEVDANEVDAEAVVAAAEKAIEAPSNEGKVLVKMARNNRTYEAQGYVFTQEQPFVLMEEDKANDLFAHNTGFHPATPQEAKEFFGV